MLQLPVFTFGAPQPCSAEAELARADTYLDQGQRQEAEKILLALLDAAERPTESIAASAKYKLAKLALSRKQYRRAEQTCSEAANGFLNAFGSHSEAHSDAIILLTVIYLALEEETKAADCHTLLASHERTLPERFILCSKELSLLVLHGLGKRAGEIGCKFLKENYTANLPWKLESDPENDGLNWTELQLNIERGGFAEVSKGFSTIHYLSIAKPEACIEIDYIIKSGANVDAVWNMPGRQDIILWQQCTPLMNAAAAGQLEACRLLLLHGANPKAKSYRGRTAVFLAAWQGHVQILEMLRWHGLTLDSRDTEGDTALSLACYRGRFGAVDYLIKQGAKYDTTDNKQYTAMHLAAEGNNKEILELLLSKGLDIESKTHTQQRPTHRAAVANALVALEWLLDNGAELEARDENGETPLHFAAADGKTDCMRLLVARGANVNAPDMNGDTPLHVAAAEGRLESVETLLTEGADIHIKGYLGDSPIHRAALKGHAAVATLLLQKGANANAKADDTNTPLQVACDYEHVDVISTLVSHGADASAVDEDGNSCIMRAAVTGKLEVLAFLLDKGVPLTSKDYPAEGSSTILDGAVRSGRLAIVQLLAAKLRDQCQQWLLHPTADTSVIDIAAALGHHEVLDELLQLTPEDWNVDAKRLDDGSTTLHLAAWSGHSLCIQLLCERKASTTCQNSQLDTPLHIVCRRGHPAALKVMLDIMAASDDVNGSHPDINIKNARQMTPLLEAVQQGNDECVRLLLEVGASITGKPRPEETYYKKQKPDPVNSLRVYHEKFSSMPEPDSSLLKALVQKSEPWADSLISMRHSMMSPSSKSKKSCGGDPLWICCNARMGASNESSVQKSLAVSLEQLKLSE